MSSPVTNIGGFNVPTDLLSSTKIQIISPRRVNVINEFRGLSTTVSIYDVSPSNESAKTLLSLVSIVCQSRKKGDFCVGVNLPDGNTKLASFSRDKRSKKPVTVSVHSISNQDIEMATISNSSQIEIASSRPSGGTSVTFEAKGSSCCSQPQVKHICCAFLLFFPTLALGTLYCNNLAEKDGWSLAVTRTADENKQPMNDMILEAKNDDGDFCTTVNFDGIVDGRAGAKEKLALLLLAIFKVADSLAVPPSSGGSGGSTM